MFSIEAIPCLTALPLQARLGLLFSFSAYLRFLSTASLRVETHWFPLTLGWPLPLSLPTNGSHASNRADNLFRWCVPLPSSQNRTQALTVAYLFSPCSLLTFPLRGKAVLFSKLGCPGFLDSSTTASHGSNGAGLRPLWVVPLPSLQNRTQGLTGPRLVLTAVSWCASFAAALLAGAPGGNLPPRRWAESCKAASRFSRSRPMSTRWSAGFR